jgi:hypothetical protein
MSYPEHRLIPKKASSKGHDHHDRQAQMSTVGRVTAENKNRLALKEGSDENG